MAPQRDWYTTDYYKVLGVSESATDKELRRAYRKLAKQYHPDSNPGSEDRFKAVSAAYDVLGDPDKRKEYDEVRRLGPLSNLGGFGGGGGAGNGGFNFRIDDLSDIFGGPLRARAPRRRTGRPWYRHGPAARPRPRGRAAPVLPGGRRRRRDHGQCHERDDAARPAAARARARAPRRSCARAAAASECSTTTRACSRCRRPAPSARAAGPRSSTPARACNGTGLEQRQRQVKVRIPAGVEDGQRIRVKGRGEPGANGGPAGDLFVIVHVAPHPLFGRAGRNLTLTVPITYPEATLGSAITVPTLGEPVTLKIPAGTRQGRTFRVKGHGIATRLVERRPARDSRRRRPGPPQR